ncbi:hypothetical protein [Massilia soli]|uniref:Uncharacterized protein n=1 Tax=Massilia soli TaxID=2792854 RepID=A0ABS7SSE7_9BURK|nr:hypothetical protein [Massilia soli]MBZ2208846.1 hypothetical protein [Massilia soli]
MVPLPGRAMVLEPALAGQSAQVRRQVQEQVQEQEQGLAPGPELAPALAPVRLAALRQLAARCAQVQPAQAQAQAQEQEQEQEQEREQAVLAARLAQAPDSLPSEEFS